MADPILRAVAANTASGTSVGVTVPAEAQVGDVLVLVGSGYGSDAGMTPGAGWTQLTSQTATTPFSATGRHEVWVRDTTVQAGQPGSQTVTLAQSESDQVNVALIVVGDADPADLLDGTVDVVTSAGTNSGSITSGTTTTTTVPNALVIRSYMQWSGGSGATWVLSGQTEQSDVGSWDRHAIGTEIQTAAGAVTARQGQTLGSSGRQQVITFAVKGASSTTPDPVEAEFAQTAPAFEQAAGVDATVTVDAAQTAPAFTQAAAFDVEEVFTPDVVDEFDRDDNPSLGGDWDILNGLLGIEDQRARVTTAGWSIATLDCGSSNGEVRLDVPVLGGEWWLIFRLTDVSNYWRFGTDGNNGYVVQAIVAAGIAVNIDTGVAPQAGDRLSVVADGRDLDFQVNGVSAATVTQSFNAHATNHGIAVFSPGGDAAVRFERFAMQTAPTVVQTPGVVVDDFEVDDGPLLAASAGQRWQALQGDWQVDGGKARHTTSNGAHGQVVVDGAEPDGALTVNITLADVDTVAGVIVRGIDEMNHILIEPTVGGPGDENKIGVYKRDEGTYQAIVDQPMSLVPGATHDLTIWVDGDHFVVRLDGDFLFDFTLDAEDAAKYASGTLVGLYSHRQTGYDDGTTRFNSFQWLAGVGAPVFGDAESTVPAITSAAIGAVTVTSVVASDLAALKSDAVGEVDTDPYGVDAVVGTVASQLTSIASDADGTLTVSGDAGSTIPAIASDVIGDSTVSVAVAGALPTTSSDAVVDVTVFSIAANTLAAPVADVDARVGDDVSAAVTSELPGVITEADGSVRVAGAVAVNLPALGSSSVGQVGDDIVATISSVLAGPSSDSTGQVSTTGTASQTIPAPSSSASGLVYEDVSGAINAVLPAINTEASGRSDAVKRVHSGVFTVADSFADRFFSSQLPSRFEIAGTLASRFDVADPLPRRFFEIVFYRKAGSEEADDMELVIVPYGPHTATEVPRPLWIRVMERLRDQSVVPYPIHDVTPALTGSVIIEKPSGAIVGPREIVIPDPATLHTIDPANFSEDLPAEDRVGWCYVEWKTGDLDEVSADTDVSEWKPGAVGHYGVQVTFDNRDMNGDGIYLITPTVWSPQVRRGPASQVP